MKTLKLAAFLFAVLISFSAVGQCQYEPEMCGKDALFLKQVLSCESCLYPISIRFGFDGEYPITIGVTEKGRVKRTVTKAQQLTIRLENNKFLYFPASAVSHSTVSNDVTITMAVYTCTKAQMEAMAESAPRYVMVDFTKGFTDALLEDKEAMRRAAHCILYGK